MLTRLSIRDIVLIDRLDIDFVAGLAVLTGETGAGKSILLDAFALALGARGDAALVRHGAEQGQVIGHSTFTRETRRIVDSCSNVRG
jgi:DNA repair protein RecN (Recombination protein N)